MSRDIVIKIERKTPFNPDWYIRENREKWVLPLILKDRAKRFGKRPFLQYQNDKPLTFKRVNTFANKLANGLIKLGIRKGDRVAVLMPNSTEYVLIWFGILKAGGVMAPINTAYKMDFLHYIIDNSDSRFIFIGEEHLERLIPIQDRIPNLEKIVVCTTNLSNDFKNPGIALKPLISYRELVDNSNSSEPKVHVIFTDISRLM